MFDMQGVFDIHVHTDPDAFPRLGDDVAVTDACARVGMAGIALKCHVESTASRAHHLNRDRTGFRAVGGVVLNYAVGGINPAAVEACLRLGGGIVWMPTGHSAHHAELTGGLGKWGPSFMKLYVPEGATGLTVLDDEGALTDEARTTLELIAEHDALLATGHLSAREILAVLDAASALGVRVLVNHPMYIPACGLDFIEEVTSAGAWVEICAVTVGGFWSKLTLDQVQAMIETAGPERVVLASDGGGIQTPMPHEALRVFADNLLHIGVNEEHVRRMASDNPRELVGLAG